MQPNEQQRAVLDWIDHGTGSCNVIARPGCGKTALIVMACHHIQHGRVFVGAFNRAIADEINNKLPARPGLTCNTIHGAGLKAWKSQYRFVEVDGSKVRSIARATWAMDAKTAAAAETVIGYVKQVGLGLVQPYEDLDLWEQVIDHYDLEDEIPNTMRRQAFLENCVWTYEISLDWCLGKGPKNGVPTLDFNDMLLAPLYYKAALPQVHWAMLDEAQDTSMLRRKIVIGMIQSGGRLIAAGDPRQACYHFAGASAGAMDLIKEELGSIELPLNVTYRCPRLVVEMAQQWIPDFTAHPSAPDGVIREISHTDFWMEKFNPDTDVIICRVTRPLVGIAVNLRDRGIRCVVEGQSSKSLIYLVNKWGDISVSKFLDMLGVYADEMATKHAGNPEKLARVTDRIGTVRAVAERVRHGSTKDVKTQIELMFRDQDTRGMLTLCTVHRFKGREAERVFLVGRNRYQPGWWASSKEEIEEEENLQIIAVTRTKRELVEVRVPEVGEGEAEWWELN